MTKCEKCSQGPKGVEGHADLFVATMSGGAMQFRCRSCGSLWMRQQTAHGPEWTDALGVNSGATLPQSNKSGR